MKTRKNIILIFTSSIIILTLAIVSGYQYWNYRSFTALVNQAQTSLQSEDYAKAISLFEQAQAIKPDPTITNSISLAKQMEQDKPKYIEASKKLSDKLYLDAMNDFNKIMSYKDSKDKSAQCKKLYIDDNLAKAKDAAGNQKYQDALTFVENVLIIDSENNVAKQLKVDYEKAITDKKAVEEKAKADQIAQAATQKAKNSQKISSPEAAGQLVFERVYTNNPGIGYVFGSEPEMYNGVECYGVKAYSKQMRADGGTGTVGVFQVEINTGSIWDL